MEPMLLGSPSSPSSPVILPNFLFGDQPALPASHSPPRQSDFPSPILRMPEQPSFYRRGPSPVTTRESHRPGAPPVVDLGDVAASYAKARRLLDYSQAMPHEERPPYDSFQIARANETHDCSGMNGGYAQPLMNCLGETDYENNAPYPRRSESGFGHSTTSRVSFFEKPRQEEPEPVTEGSWVTVFGFPPDKANSVLQCFLSCGGVVEHKRGGNDANWIHLKYGSAVAAERALAKNGTIVQGCMVGVKRDDSVETGAGNVLNGVLQTRLGARTSFFHDSGASPGPARNPAITENGIRILGQNTALNELSPPARNSSMFSDRPIPQREKGFIKWAVDWILGV